MKTIKIYLAGSVKKGKDDNHKKFYWTDREKQEMVKGLDGIEVLLLDPQIVGKSLVDPVASMGRDMYFVTNSDFIVVDARERRGLGVGVEIAIAKMHNIPVIPKDSHYKKEELTYLGRTVKDYVHPFLYCCSDAVVESLEEAARWIRAFLENPKKVKGKEVVEEAIKHYKDNHFEQDVTRESLERLEKKF